MKTVRRAVVLSLLLLGGCSKAHEPNEPALTSEEKQPPLSVVIDQAFVSGEKLHVKGIVEAKTFLDPAKISVTLKGLEDGELKQEQTKRLSELATSPKLGIGSRTAVWFSIPAAEINEYEVLCSWGEDAERKAPQLLSTTHSETLSGKIPTPSPAKEVEASAPLPQRERAEQTGELTLREVAVERAPQSCREGLCDEMVAVTGKLLNGTREMIDSVQLLLGLKWVPEGTTIPEPLSDLPKEDSEEVVSLDSLALRPGESREIRVRVADAVPVVPGGQFTPQLRLSRNSAR